MSLTEQLAALREGAASRLPAEVRAELARATQELMDSRIIDGVVKVGSRLPAFALRNQHGKIIRSDEQLAKGLLVLSVFRGCW